MLFRSIDADALANAVLMLQGLNATASPQATVQTNTRATPAPAVPTTADPAPAKPTANQQPVTAPADPQNARVPERANANARNH